MGKRGVVEWIHHPKINQILLSFSVPKTPRHVEKELGIEKLKLKPFLEKHLLKSLNTNSRKGRVYILTNKAKKLLNLSEHKKYKNLNWDLIGWIMASPMQRLVVIKSVDSEKRTSEEIRQRSSRLNNRLTRISTKAILKELVSKGFIETEIKDRKRYYWISEKGKLIMNDISRQL